MFRGNFSILKRDTLNATILIKTNVSQNSNTLNVTQIYD